MFFMLDFNKDALDFYTDYVSKELYKSRVSSRSAYDFKKLIVVSKVNRSTYWFPTHSGRRTEKYYEQDKLRLAKSSTSHLVYNFNGFSFLSNFELYINFAFNLNSSKLIQSKKFGGYLSLVNEVIRKQELKRYTPRVRELRTEAWKYRPSNDYAVLKYYFTFEPHRNLFRARKLDFFVHYGWLPKKKRWIFSYKNMHLSYLRHRKLQKFEYKFFRFKGMSFRYWAKQQLQYNYLNETSSDFLMDPYGSNSFRPSYPSVTFSQLSKLFYNVEQPALNAVFLYWLIKESCKNTALAAMPTYFSNTYNFHQVSHTVKYNYLKHFFSYNTPKFAHIYYEKIHATQESIAELSNYFSLYKPCYWNLKQGLDSYPHEHWDWDAALWWGDSINFFFPRFLKNRRKNRFPEIDFLDGSNFMWFYKSWFHEEIYTELHSSYYKSHINIDYLLPNWRMYTDYPRFRMSHFDPNWHERLDEYVVYQYMNLFHPSTKRYYINYATHPDYVDSNSFLILNFLWKPRVMSLFNSQLRPKTRKVLRSSGELDNVLDGLKPEFLNFSNGSKFSNFFPLLLLEAKKPYNLFSNYNKSLIFLVNVFTRSHLLVPTQKYYFEYLFFYISNFFPTNVTKQDFVVECMKLTTPSYRDIFKFLSQFLFLSSSELRSCEERIIAEYIAFKRFYSLIVSGYGNTK